MSVLNCPACDKPIIVIDGVSVGDVSYHLECHPDYVPPPPKFGEWQPMETAPKHIEILAFFDCRDVQDDGIVDIVYWDDAIGPDKIGGWMLGCESDCSRAPGYYTKWMPLPTPPTAES